MRDIIICALAVVISTGMVSFLWHEPLFLFLVLAIIAGFLVKAWGVENYGRIFIFAALLGPAVEIPIVLSGAWTYADFSVVPFWLPLAWGIAVVSINRSCELFNHRYR